MDHVLRDPKFIVMILHERPEMTIGSEFQLDVAGDEFLAMSWYERALVVRASTPCTPPSRFPVTLIRGNEMVDLSNNALVTVNIHRRDADAHARLMISRAQFAAFERMVRTAADGNRAAQS